MENHLFSYLIVVKNLRNKPAGSLRIKTAEPSLPVYSFTDSTRQGICRVENNRIIFWVAQLNRLEIASVCVECIRR
jgi:hypothetical protein